MFNIPYASDEFKLIFTISQFGCFVWLILCVSLLIAYNVLMIVYTMIFNELSNDCNDR